MYWKDKYETGALAGMDIVAILNFVSTVPHLPRPCTIHSASYSDPVPTLGGVHRYSGMVGMPRPTGKGLQAGGAARLQPMPPL